MKTFVKLILIGIYILLNTGLTSAQQWIESTLPSAAGHNTGQASFVNPNTGYSFAYKYDDSFKLYKTTNKGLNWIFMNSLGDNIDQFTPQVFFINENTGWVALKKLSLNNWDKIYKTTNGGVNFTEINSSEGLSPVTNLIFVNENTGYCSRNANFNIQKTTNSGVSWTTVYENVGSFRYVTHMDYSKSDNSKIYVTGYLVEDNLTNPVLIKTANGFSSTSVVYNGQNDPDGLGRLNSISVVDGGTSNDMIRLISQTGIYSFNNSNNNVSQLNSISLHTIAFSNINTNIGYGLYGRQIYYTNNGGVKCTLEHDPSGSHPYSLTPIAFNDVGYRGGIDGKVYTRIFPTVFVTNFDGGSGTGSLLFDAQSYNTPSTQNVRGGYSDISANLTLQNSSLGNTEAIFYKWNSGFMPRSRNDELYITSTSINANYKTKKYSTSGTAINNSVQRRAVRDVNGTVHTIHESMNGGIFYTKSTNNGSSFSQEEIVTDRSGYNHWATTGNINSLSVKGISFPVRHMILSGDLLYAGKGEREIQ